MTVMASRSATTPITRPTIVSWSDGVIAGIAAAGFVGARFVPPVPGGVAALAVGFAVVVAMATTRRGVPRLAVAGLVAAATSVFAARSMAGLHPRAIGRWSGPAAVLSDPQWRAGGVGITVRVGGKRLLATARGPAALTLARRSAGETVMMTGTITSLTPPVPGWMVARHLSGRIQLRTVGAQFVTSLPWRLANAVRRALLRSATVLPRDRRALFAGFVLGDARDQAPEVADDFRAAGLTHLLVVSGQNVAFTLAAVEPITSRLRRRWRLAATIGVLALFATITRFEPSVLRASVMAAVVLVTRHLGRPQSGLRVLGLAVIALLLVDPLLAGSLGFGLSVAACLGIALLDRPLRRALPGPDWLRRPLATTLAAQLGTLLLLVPLTGGFVLASIPANLLALPVAEPVMVWGVAAGLPAGIVGRRASQIAHLPTNVALWWVAGVARRVGRVPFGTLGGATLVASLAVFGVLVYRPIHAARSRRGPSARRGFLAKSPAIALAGLLLTPLGVSFRGHRCDGCDIARGARVWSTARTGPSRRADVLQLEFGADAARVLAALRRRHIDAVDLVVIRTGGRPQATTLASISRRVRVGAVMAGDRSFAGSVRPFVPAADGMVVVAGAFRIAVERNEHGRLALTISGVFRGAVGGPITGVVGGAVGGPVRGSFLGNPGPVGTGPRAEPAAANRGPPPRSEFAR